MAGNDDQAYQFVEDVSGMLHGAAQIVPAVLPLIGPVNSVVDLGGGTGAWLREFQKAGATKLQLVDSAAAEPFLVVPREWLKAVNLEEELPSLGRFDLAISIECAEHVSEGRSEAIVRWLTAAADVVLFSAATLGQGGKDHINEQLPTFWQELFRREGFVRRDVVRPRILSDTTIPWWYRQNLFLFVKQGHQLQTAEPDFLPEEFSLVHRTVENSYRSPRLRHVLRSLGPALAASVKSRLGLSRPRNN